jgi:hypothetical protein
MDYAERRARLVVLLYDGRAAVYALVNGLTPNERVDVGTLAHWSAKDVVAHITSWWARQVERLTTIIGGGEPIFYAVAEQDQLNAETFTQQRDRPWADVLNEETRIFPQLVARVERVAQSEDVLTEPQRFPRLQGIPLWRHVIQSGYTHPVLHVSEYYLDHGDRSRAIHWQQEAATALGVFTDVPAVAASPHYNLAGLYAQSGELERAMVELRDACTRNAAFLAVAHDDADLVPLHALPAYQALLTQ